MIKTNRYELHEDDNIKEPCDFFVKELPEIY